MHIKYFCSIALISILTVPVFSVASSDDPIAALNRVIQERFKDVDKMFGARRIVLLGDTPHRFRPESVAEFSAVQGLVDAKLRVAIYLAGRRVLDREPDLSTKVPYEVNRRVIIGPVAVTPADSQPTLPAEVDLIDESRVAFQHLAQREQYEFESTGWRFTARAVRATSAECLTCHRGRQLGEPLGVVLYAYQRRQQ